MKELRQGVKAPFHGFLLGVKEYEKYRMLKELAPQLVEKVKEIKED